MAVKAVKVVEAINALKAVEAMGAKELQDFKTAGPHDKKKATLSDGSFYFQDSAILFLQLPERNP
jgi:hypothetical protein